MLATNDGFEKKNIAILTANLLHTSSFKSHNSFHRMTRKDGSNFNLVQLRRIVELYSCTFDKGCMMSERERLKNPKLVDTEFANKHLSSDFSDSESENLDVKFLRWSKHDSATKIEVTIDVEDRLLHGKKP